MAESYDADEAAEAECVRALHATGAAGRAVKLLETRIAATRGGLIVTLTGRFGWTSRGVAAELGVSEQMISKILRKEKERNEEEQARLHGQRERTKGHDTRPLLGVCRAGRVPVGSRSASTP